MTAGTGLPGCAQPSSSREHHVTPLHRWRKKGNSFTGSECRILWQSVSIGKQKVIIYSGGAGEGWDCCAPVRFTIPLKPLGTLARRRGDPISVTAEAGVNSYDFLTWRYGARCTTAPPRLASPAEITCEIDASCDSDIRIRRSKSHNASKSHANPPRPSRIPPPEPHQQHTHQHPAGHDPEPGNGTRQPIG